MSDDILKIAKENIMNAEKSAQDAEKLIAVMQAAGEDTTGLRTQLAKSKTKIQKWKSALEANGV